VSAAGPSGAPAPKTRPCRACSAEIAADARACDRCGVLQRDDVRCPHCGAVADARPHPELFFVCEACGGPRVPQDDPVLRSAGGEVAPLRRAEAARRARAGWTAAGFGASAALALLLGALGLVALAFGAGLKLAIAAAVLAAPLVALLATAVRRVSARGKEIRPALDVAWEAAAAGIAEAAPRAIAASDLARALRVDEPRAEELLALLDAADVVQGTVTEAGELAFRSTLADRVRIEVPPDAAGAPGATEIATSLEAEREAEAEPEVAAGARAKKDEG
jgi:hypothetical protein